MLEADIEVALTKVLVDSSVALRWAFPNQDDSGSKPFGLVEIVRIQRRDDTMEGQQTISQGRMVVTVVDELNKSTRAANTLADSIAALFPMSSRIPVTGGEIVITKPADIREGQRDGNTWRTPVLIDYEAQ